MNSILNYTVSVIIPVYNGEQFISRAINSVLNQSLKADEIIVINDGSNDGTSFELDKFGDLIHVITIPNGGVSNARNVGILASSKTLIAFLDADDVWNKDKLLLQLSVFNDYPSVGFCACDYIYFSELHNREKKFFSNFYDSELNFDEPLLASPFLQLLMTNFVGTCSNVMFKRSLIDKVGLFDVTLKQSEDYDIWLKFSLVTSFFLLNKDLVIKHKHSSNLTNNFIETMICHEDVLLNLPKNKLFKEHITDNYDFYRSELAKFRYKIANHYFDNNQKIKSFKYFIRGLFTVFTLQNFICFCHFFSKKLFRLLTFDYLKK